MSFVFTLRKFSTCFVVDRNLGSVVMWPVRRLVIGWFRGSDTGEHLYL